MKRFWGQTNTQHELACRAILVALIFLAASAAVQAQNNASEQQKPAPQTPAQAMRLRYQINLQLDFDARTYTGTERVRWVNRDDRPASVLYFHLYANLRVPLQRGASQSAADEPRLEISEVRAAATGAPQTFSIDEQGTVLRVNLREAVAPNASTEVIISFKGSVPEIDTEETGLLVHVLQQVGAALRSERETRRPRDINYRCRGVMLLGTSYPVLAARDGGEWQRKVETSIGDTVFAETADYEVAIDAPTDVALFASAPSRATSSLRSERAGYSVREFSGENLRDFAIVGGRGLRVAERVAGDVTVRSVFMPEHETTAKRVLAQAADAVRVYSARFGALPHKTVTIVDAPLVAGLGSTEFSGLAVIASAFYVDFDSPSKRNLPEIVREQRASLEDSLEFTVAHVVAQQWWGVAVGNNPERDPVMDEALANWSALLYYREIHSEERAEAALDDQLRGVYKVYRTFGGEDMAATRPAREYRNFFQYAAIVSSKGALMFVNLRKLMGDEKFFAALRSYYETNLLEIASLDDLRGAFVGETPRAQRRTVTRTFARWLSDKRGDEDVAPPDARLAAALGLNPNVTKNDRNAFARLGRFFWQQMTRLR